MSKKQGSVTQIKAAPTLEAIISNNILRYQKLNDVRRLNLLQVK